MSKRMQLSVFTVVLFAPFAVGATSYYVDSASGSDWNSGLAPDAAWASNDRVNAASLRPGDQILFRRGASFTGMIVVNSSGSRKSPIAYGAYGSGADPIIAGGTSAVTGQGKKWITIKNLQIRNTSGAGIDARNGSDHWRYDNIDFQDTNGGFWLIDVNDHDIRNCHIHNGSAEGVWGWNIDGLKVVNCQIDRLTGQHTDGIQFEGVSNYTVVNNTINMTGTDSKKGEFISQGNMLRRDPGINLIANNLLIGGNYGLAMGDDHVTIMYNHIIGHNGADWASGIQYREATGYMGTNPDVHDVRIIGNLIENAFNGVQLWGSGTRENITVTGNVIESTTNPINQNGDARYVDCDIAGNISWHDGQEARPTSPLRGTIGASAVRTLRIGRSDRR
jgi:polysaccharidase protein